MAWTFTTKQICAELSGLPTTIYQDEWSDWIEELIADYMGIQSIGTTVELTEYHDGDGSDALVVKQPPVVSVSLVSVSDASVNTASYKVYTWGVRLFSSEGTEVEKSMITHSVFPVGVQNVKIVYTSGKATVPKRVQLAATLMINQVALVSQREGADASIKYSIPDREMDEEPETRAIGLHKVLKTIMKTVLHKRMRIGG